ncbi:hypothetical protein [Vandammella animalimorsus]|uniref:hypothetical protein n=1 Tax=Vandammella animalimorsus TaxID=2029117 RepID=UPI0011776D1F|nr:hypothetical protein [Vandammella animalimorsus]
MKAAFCVGGEWKCRVEHGVATRRRSQSALSRRPSLESLFKISARVGKKRFGVGCKAQNAAIAGLWRGFATQQSAQIRSLDRRAKILNRL